MTDNGRSYLLDTHILIWLSADLSRIPHPVLELLEDADVQLYVSTVSFWEITIKQMQGKFQAALDLERLAASRGIEELPVSSRYLGKLRELPVLHGDPFDRMIVAQAMEDGLVLVTADRRLAEYPVAMLRV